MKRFRISLHNYRCFSDEEPAQLEIGPGFTALVGRNNSGKSALKLLFFEMRPLFQMLSNGLNASPSVADALVPGWRYVFNFEGVSDNEEIFCNTNLRDLSIAIEVIEPQIHQREHADDCLWRVVATTQRAMPNQWSFACFGAKEKSFELTQHNGRGRPGLATPTVANVSGRRLDCKDFLEVAAAIMNARYYGAFRNPINEGGTRYFDLSVGSSFIDLWNSWKTGGNRAQMRAIDQISNDIRRLFEFQRLEINASAALKTLMVSIDGKPYRLIELGSGLSQFIMALGNAATSPPSILLIDEPETNLHPALQIDFLLALARHATYGVVFSTHSVGLARSVAEAIYSVQKIEDRSVVRRFEATPNYLEFVGELSFSTFKELGSDRIFLVEGVHDVKVLVQFLRLVHEEHRTVILPLGGNQLASGDREFELEQLTRLSNNIYAIVDSERKQATDRPSSERLRFQETCEKLGIRTCVTERRAIENYFTDRAIKAALGAAYGALNPFQLLREAPNAWSKADNWKIARQMELEDLAGTDLGIFISRLATD